MILLYSLNLDIGTVILLINTTEHVTFAINVEKKIACYGDYPITAVSNLYYELSKEIPEGLKINIDKQLNKRR